MVSSVLVNALIKDVIDPAIRAILSAHPNARLPDTLGKPTRPLKRSLVIAIRKDTFGLGTLIKKWGHEAGGSGQLIKVPKPVVNEVLRMYRASGSTWPGALRDLLEKAIGVSAVAADAEDAPATAAAAAPVDPVPIVPAPVPMDVSGEERMMSTGDMVSTAASGVAVVAGLVNLGLPQKIANFLRATGTVIKTALDWSVAQSVVDQLFFQDESGNSHRSFVAHLHRELTRSPGVAGVLERMWSYISGTETAIMLVQLGLSPAVAKVVAAVMHASSARLLYNFMTEDVDDSSEEGARRKLTQTTDPPPVNVTKAEENLKKAKEEFSKKTDPSSPDYDEKVAEEVKDIDAGKASIWEMWKEKGVWGRQWQREEKERQEQRKREGEKEEESIWARWARENTAAAKERKEAKEERQRKKDATSTTTSTTTTPTTTTTTATPQPATTTTTPLPSAKAERMKAFLDEREKKFDKATVDFHKSQKERKEAKAAHEADPDNPALKTAFDDAHAKNKVMMRRYRALGGAHPATKAELALPPPKLRALRKEWAEAQEVRALYKHKAEAAIQKEREVKALAEEDRAAKRRKTGDGDSAPSWISPQQVKEGVKQKLKDTLVPDKYEEFTDKQKEIRAKKIIEPPEIPDAKTSRQNVITPSVNILEPTITGDEQFDISTGFNFKLPPGIRAEVEQNPLLAAQLMNDAIRFHGGGKEEYHGDPFSIMQGNAELPKPQGKLAPMVWGNGSKELHPFRPNPTLEMYALAHAHSNVIPTDPRDLSLIGSVLYGLAP